MWSSYSYINRKVQDVQHDQGIEGLEIEGLYRAQCFRYVDYIKTAVGLKRGNKRQYSREINLECLSLAYPTFLEIQTIIWKPLF